MRSPQSAVAAAAPATTAAALSLALALAGCGDNLAGVPPPLVDDPAAERGCAPIAEDNPEPFSRAKRIACAEELPRGLLTAGRTGDILLENDRIQVVVRAFGEGFLFPGTPPGGLVDAARRGGDDQLKELLPIVELNVSSGEEIALVEAGDDGPATVVVRGRAMAVPLVAAAIGTGALGAAIETHYILAPGHDHVIARTFVSRIPGEATPAEVQVGDLFFFGGVVEPFVPGAGTPDEQVVRGPMLASAGSATTSYGIAFGGGELQVIDIANVSAAIGGELAVGERRPVERAFIIGDGSISSVVARGHRLRGEDTEPVRGTLSRPPAAAAGPVDVVLEDDAGAPLAIARAGEDGFEAELPPGTYTARAASDAHAPADPVTATAGGEPVTVPLGPSGLLSITVADPDGAPLPARVAVRGDGVSRILYSGADGAAAVALPPGTYAVDVSRGVEYDAYSAVDLELADGAEIAVPAVLERVVDTAGWIAVDSHLHSEMSADSRIPLADRLRAVAGEGVEVAISTDHDFLTDYGALLADLGLDGWVASRVGCETSSLLWGHVNAWPLEPDPDRAGRGAIAWYGKSPGQVFDEMRAAGPGVLIQINHPRRGSSGLLEAIEFDPDTAMATRDPAELGLEGADLNDLDFDAIEVANGKSDPFEVTFADWLALVAIGHPAAATGSSDSHGLSQFVGLSRTYVWVGEGADDPATIDLDAVDQALRARLAVVSQGAFVTAALEDPATGAPAAPGAVPDLSGQALARLHVRVQAPPWMPTARVRVFAGRDQALAVELDPDATGPVRHDDVIEVPLPEGGGDSFFVVLVDPAGPGAPVLGEVDPSFTNPLLYDADGDGASTP